MIITTKSEDQIFIEANDFHDTPLEKRGFKLTVTLDGYVAYPMHSPIRWIHMGEEKGEYKIYKLIWEDGKTKIYIKEA